MNEETKTYVAREGNSVELDLLDAACEPFGYKHGDRVFVKHLREKATVIGVGRDEVSDFDVLWIALDDDNGRVSYGWPYDKDDYELLTRGGRIMRIILSKNQSEILRASNDQLFISEQKHQIRISFPEKVSRLLHWRKGDRITIEFDPEDGYTVARRGDADSVTLCKNKTGEDICHSA